MLKKLLKSLLSIAVIYSAATGINIAQTNNDIPKRVNFSYSQNPKTKAKPSGDGVKSSNPEIAAKINSQSNTDDITAQSIVDNSLVNNDETKNTSIAIKTLDIVRRASAEAVSPTEIYKIGVGDTLFISLQNAPSNSSSYFTVLNDGTIDYPFAGQLVSVAGLTAEEIEDLLKEKIKLFENPQVAVKVREHASHSITVLGLVEKAGIKFLPREAMPLYFVRAEAVVQSKANQVVIKNAKSGTEILDLNETKNENVLIFPGDIVEFKYRDDIESTLQQPQFYYIGGNVVSGGQKDFHRGLTLTQAILASGGLRKSNVKKIIIRRKNAQGLLVATEVNIKSINDGKEPDPTLDAGDTIEVGN